MSHEGEYRARFAVDFDGRQGRYLELFDDHTAKLTYDIPGRSGVEQAEVNLRKEHAKMFAELAAHLRKKV